MKFKAISTFTVFHDDAMHVFNAGDKGELPDAVIGQYVDSGLAAVLKGKAAKDEPKSETEGDDAAAAAAPVADADAPPA